MNQVYKFYFNAQLKPAGKGESLLNICNILLVLYTCMNDLLLSKATGEKNVAEAEVEKEVQLWIKRARDRDEGRRMRREKKLKGMLLRR